MVLFRHRLPQINLVQEPKAELRRTTPRDHRMVGNAAPEIDQPYLLFDEVVDPGADARTRIGQVADCTIDAEVATSVDKFSAEQNSWPRAAPALVRF
jgi:hypothetical protein